MEGGKGSSPKNSSADNNELAPVNNVPFLPELVICNILLRVPNVQRFALVCRGWQDLINSDFFMRQYKVKRKRLDAGIRKEGPPRKKRKFN